MLEEEVQQLVLRTSQQAGGDLASKLELARVTDELEDQRRTHTTQVKGATLFLWLSLSSAPPPPSLPPPLARSHAPSLPGAERRAHEP